MRRIKKDKRLLWYLGFVALLSLVSIGLDQIAIQSEITIREKENRLFKTTLLLRNIDKYDNQILLSDNIIYTRFKSLEQNKNLPTDVKNKFYGVLLENLYDSIQRVVYAEDVMGNFYEEKITRFQELRPFPKQHYEEVVKTGGIGIAMELHNGKIMIVDVLEDYPAEKSGIQKRDHITHVDSQSVSDLSLTAITRMITGEIGTTVELTIRRGEETFIKKIKREPIELPLFDILSKSKVLQDDKLSEDLKKSKAEFQKTFEKNAKENLTRLLEFSNSLKTTIISRKNDTVKRVTKDDQNIESYERNRQSILIYGMLSQIFSLFFLLLFFKRLFSYTLVKMK